MRASELYISTDTLRKLRSAAEILDLPTAEAVAEQWLAERLAQMPEVDELIQLQRKASAQVREQWRQKQLKTGLYDK